MGRDTTEPAPTVEPAPTSAITIAAAPIQQSGPIMMVAKTP